ncbi:hypothetical protein JRI60_29450 [Archangium violaceum]|uniref:hypothetical protein n=1 Tax=Archangium violaceum TaxID=83451 RepID=UPI0019529B61|nr:hypothetical protein [Archangium violaceum]QRN93315.1 hypothetical protein JRI60_29450 [Archangium violaceum]
MRHALAFLTLALLVTGCPKKTGENPDGAVDNPSYRDGGQSGDAGETASAGAALSGATPTEGTQAQDGERATVEACVDRWLQAHKMDRYGHPEGTMYAGGTPLFNEATGETKDRLEYVFARQPEARKACAAKDAQ